MTFLIGKEEHKRPAKEMSIEWKDRTGGNKSAAAIQQTVERLTATDRRSYEKPDYETCAISDLERLIKAANAFYHKKRQPQSHTGQRSRETRAKGVVPEIKYLHGTDNRKRKGIRLWSHY